MYIERVILKGVPGIPDQDLRFYDDWRKEPIKSVLIKGLNGSGKTTILRAISVLWEYFIGVGTPVPYTNRLANLINAELLAIRIVDLWELPIWIYTSPDNRTLGNSVDLGDDLVFDSIRINRQSNSTELTHGYNETYKELLETVERLHLGVSNGEYLLPNMVFLETNARQIPQYASGERSIIAEPLYRWLVRFDPYDRTNSLEIMLRNLKLRDPQWFQETLNSINEFLRENGKRLTDFDDSLRLRVETLHNVEKFHYIEDLSSGEPTNVDPDVHGEPLVATRRRSAYR
jgi:hypothetical protein